MKRFILDRVEMLLWPDPESIELVGGFYTAVACVYGVSLGVLLSQVFTKFRPGVPLTMDGVLRLAELDGSQGKVLVFIFAPWLFLMAYYLIRSILRRIYNALVPEAQLEVQS